MNFRRVIMQGMTNHEKTTLRGHESARLRGVKIDSYSTGYTPWNMAIYVP